MYGGVLMCVVFEIVGVEVVKEVVCVGMGVGFVFVMLLCY